MTVRYYSENRSPVWYVAIGLKCLHIKSWYSKWSQGFFASYPLAATLPLSNYSALTPGARWEEEIRFTASLTKILLR